MKIRLTDRVCILNFKNDFEKKLMNKFLTYKDTSKCFTGGKYDPMKEENVHFLKESSKAPGNFVCFAGFCKEIILKAKDSGIEIEDFEDIEELDELDDLSFLEDKSNSISEN